MKHLLASALLIYLLLPNTALGAQTASADIERSSSQYFSVADSASLSITGGFTVAGWIKLESTPAAAEEYDLVSKHDNGASANGRSWITTYENSGGTLQFRWRNSLDGTSGNQSTSAWASTLSTGTWYHVAFVYSTTGDVTLYLNAVNLATNPGMFTSIHDNATRVTVGARDNGGGTAAAFYDGRIDDVRLWSRALSSGEIATLYASACTASNGSNLSSWWEFENNGNDSSGNANNLTNNNSITYGADLPYDCALRFAPWQFADF